MTGFDEKMAAAGHLAQAVTRAIGQGLMAPEMKRMAGQPTAPDDLPITLRDNSEFVALFILISFLMERFVGVPATNWRMVGR